MGVGLCNLGVTQVIKEYRLVYKPENLAGNQISLNIESFGFEEMEI